MIQEFFSQVSILERCNHPNIIKIKDKFYNSDSSTILFEYAEFGDLFDMVNRTGVMAESSAAKITKQLLSALDYLHNAEKIVHW